MRDDNAAWLEPLLAEAGRRGIDLRPIIARATMPAAEAMLPANPLASYAGIPGARVSAIDWIQFGRLLREVLGWHDYPELPGATPEQ